MNIVLLAAAVTISACSLVLGASESDAGPRLSRCWSSPLMLAPGSPAFVSNGRAVISTADGTLVALDLRSGEIEWRSELSGAILAIAEGPSKTLFVTTQREGIETATFELRAVSRATGLTVWRTTIDGSATRFVAATNDAVAVVGADGSISSFDAATGNLLRKAEAGSVGAIPKLAGNLILLGHTGDLAELDIRTGKLSTVKIGMTASLVSAASSDNALLADSTGRLISLDLGSNEILWEFRAGGRIAEVLPQESGTSIVISDDNFVYQMSTSYGNILWKRRMPGRVSGGTLFGAEQGVFSVVGEPDAYVLDLNNGRVVDKIVLNNDEEFLKGGLFSSDRSILVSTTRGIAGYGFNCHK